MKILHLIALVVIFSLVCSQANAVQTNPIPSNSHKSDVKPVKDKTPATTKDHSTITKSSNNRLVNNKPKVTPASHIVKHLNLPQLSIMQPSNNTSLNRDTFQIMGKSSSNMIIPLVSWNIDNSPTWIASGTTDWKFMATSLSEGVHTIHVKALDLKGNEISKSIKVTVDLKPPMVSTTSPITDDSLDHISSINGTASDDNAVGSVLVVVDNQEVYKANYLNGYWSAPVKLYAGTHVVKSIAKDKAGNSVISRDTYFSVYNPKPPVMIEHIPYAQTSPVPVATSDVSAQVTTQNSQDSIAIISPASSNSNAGGAGGSNSNSNNGFSGGGSSNSNGGSSTGGSSHPTNSHSDNGNSHSHGSNPHKP